MTPAWHLKAKLGPSLLFKGQLSTYDFIRCSLSSYFLQPALMEDLKKEAAVHFFMTY